MNKLQIFSFYRFLKIIDKKELKQKILKFISKEQLRGTIIIADEGINGSISGKRKELDELIKFIKKTLNIRKLQVKINNIDFLPFNRMKIRLKNEIVALGISSVDALKNTGIKISPEKWDKIVCDNNFEIIDTRNQFEIKIGSFKNSLNPKTENFREFPKKFKNLKIKKEKKIAMFCTGGIRCEKASSYLKQIGYKNVYQLDGGILNYLDYKNKLKKNVTWTGDCFVFDNRVTVDKNLRMGSYTQCFGCRHPLTKSEKNLKTYIKGVSCKYCHNKRNKRQINKSITRQNQIKISEERGQCHTFKKISIKNI